MSQALHNEFAPDSIEARDLAHLLHPATNLGQLHREGPLVQTHAKGVYVWDNKGKQYLEGMAGLWCTALGYGEEELARVAQEQMKKLAYSQLFAARTNEPSVLLAEKIKSMVPIESGRVFFGLSGSDANDTQVKLMWYYHNLIGKPERKKIIARRGGYHGVTVASGSLTGLPPFHAQFDLPLPNVLHTDFPHYYRERQEGTGAPGRGGRGPCGLRRSGPSGGAPARDRPVRSDVPGDGPSRRGVARRRPGRCEHSRIERQPGGLRRRAPGRRNGGGHVVPGGEVPRHGHARGEAGACRPHGIDLGEAARACADPPGGRTRKMRLDGRARAVHGMERARPRLPGGAGAAARENSVRERAPGAGEGR